MPKVSTPITIRPPAPAEIWRQTAPLPYTSNPWQLLFSDIVLFLYNAWSLPFIVLPLGPWKSGALDELYPSAANIFDITVHLLLSLAQLAFLFSLPLCLIFLVPFSLIFVYVVGFLIVNYFFCRVLLNGRKPTLESTVDLSRFMDKHEDERWIFLNGVAVGSHWLQSNINRLSLSFGRKVLGVHNPTSGIVFDILQCLIQRDFTYATEDIRNCYAVVKDALSDRQCSKVIFILHSQGGIEGGLIVDWLLAEVPGELLEKLEVYTFGNAANHFNNPLRTTGISNQSIERLNARSIAHIEHYANRFDFVSRWGVLEFASERTKQGRDNRFAGRCFEQQAKGHQFNQHYLDTMFPLDKRRGYGLLEHNAFMDAEVQITEMPEEKENNDWSKPNGAHSDDDFVPPVMVRNLTSIGQDSMGSASLLSPLTRTSTYKVHHYSRLWKYRNGMSPKD